MVAAHGSIWLGRVRANTALLISMPGPGCEIFDALDSRRMSWLRYLIYNSGWIALRRDQLWSEVWGSGMMRMCIQSYCLRLRDYLLRCARILRHAAGYYGSLFLEPKVAVLGVCCQDLFSPGRMYKDIPSEL